MCRKSNRYFHWTLVIMMVVTFALSSVVPLSAVELCTQEESIACMCDFLTVRTDDDIPCKIEICLRSPEGFFCDVVSPGTITHYLCFEQIEFYIKSVHGDLIFVDEGCVRRVPVGADCFVDACLVRDINGCLVAMIGESI